MNKMTREQQINYLSWYQTNYHRLTLAKIADVLAIIHTFDDDLIYDVVPRKNNFNEEATCQN